MDSARWQRIQTIFDDAAELPPSERDGFVHRCSGDDFSLAAEVLAMLRHDSNRDGPLEQNVAQLVSTIVGGDLVANQIGPYHIVRVLGEGGMGTVWLAERSDLDTKVAIKVLRDAWLSPARRERFSYEQRTLAQLNHPSIARLYDAAVLEDGTPYFVMEYIEGVPLTQFCRDKKLSIEQRLKLFRQVCEAVQHAHSNAVIHRDLKPSNILVKDDGSARLLDFGIAKQIEDLEHGGADQTTVGVRLMTPTYASPEQIRGDRIGIGTDVYSLGVILYQLLTGELPFDVSNLSLAEAASIIVEQDPRRPSVTVKRAVPRNSNASGSSKTAWADLDVLCLTAMNKHPERRYRSVEALIRDVDHYLKGEPLDARPDSWTYRSAKFVRRNRRAVSSAVLVLVLILAMAMYFTVRLARARNVATAESARSERVQRFMTNLFQGGDPSIAPEENLRVVTLLDRGRQQISALSAEPEIQAELYETLGELYLNLGEFAQANSLLNSALSLDKSLYGPDSTQFGRTLVALGSLRDSQGKLPEAEELVREGLDTEKRHLPRTNPMISDATSALGRVLVDRGAYSSAIDIFGEEVRWQSANRTATPELVNALLGLAAGEFYAGHYDIAESLNQRLLPISRQIFGERHPIVAGVLLNLGEIRHDLGHYSEAEQFERQALDIREQWFGKDAPQTASDLTILARTLVTEHRLDEATALLQQALAIKERVYGPVHPSVASSLNELGTIALRQKNYESAAKYFTRMVDIYQGTYGQHHYLVGIALSNLASVFAGKQQWARAQTLYRQAVQIFTETQAADHINTGIARVKLGRVLLRERRYAEAECESRAGYDILSKQMAPGVTWLVAARNDLAEEYVALKQPDKAKKFRNELASLNETPVKSSAQQ